jgi:hypothetical protein
MSKPDIFVGLTEDGNIEASFYPWYSRSHRVVIDRRTGDYISATMKLYTDEYRWLVRAARETIGK